MKFTIDMEENHQDGKIPMLDVCCWREGKNQFRHSFYEKIVASNLVVMAKSAISQGSKISSLSQEVVRRLRNTGRNIHIMEKIKILKKFMIKMSRSGYGDADRKNV